MVEVEEDRVCQRCREGVIPARGCPHTLNICRACWQRAGYPNADGIVEELCSHLGCECALPSTGISLRNCLCRRHYKELAAETWKDFYADLDIVIDYDPRCLYVGNIPFAWLEPEMTAWILDKMPERQGKERNFRVRYLTGGPKSDYNAFLECNVKFMFITFDLVRDAYHLLQLIYDTEFPVEDGEPRRRVVAHPAVKFGPAGRWPGLPRPPERDWRIR